jgi:hypothetical protein
LWFSQATPANVRDAIMRALLLDMPVARTLVVFKVRFLHPSFSFSEERIAVSERPEVSEESPVFVSSDVAPAPDGLFARMARADSSQLVA